MRTIFISVGSITTMQLVELSANTFTLLTVFLQLIIFLLTAYKLWKDIKYHRLKSLEAVEAKVEKKHPFIVNLLKLINKTKF